MCRGSIDPNSLKESPIKRIILIGLVGLIGLCAYLISETRGIEPSDLDHRPDRNASDSTTALTQPTIDRDGPARMAAEDASQSEGAAVSIDRGRTIRGAVRFDCGELNADLALLALDGSYRDATSVDERSAFRFDNVPPGRYRIDVDEQSLDGRQLPPYRQTEVRPDEANLPLGYYATTIDVADEPRQYFVELGIRCSGTLRGRVLGPHDKPVANVIVTLQMHAQEGDIFYFHNTISASALSDEYGDYRIDDIYPGPYKTMLYLTGNEPGGIKWQMPESTLIYVDAGADLVQDIRFPPNDGSIAVSGLVLDEEGVPYEDLEVLVTKHGEALNGIKYSLHDVIAEGRTDANGMYRIAGLPARQVRVQAAPFGNLGDPGENITAEPATPVILELSPSDVEVMADPVIIRRSRPFTIVVTVSDGFASETGEIDQTAPIAVTAGYIDERGIQRTKRLQRDEGGDFVLVVETPHPELQITASRNGQARTVPITPIPDEQSRLSF